MRKTRSAVFSSVLLTAATLALAPAPRAFADWSDAALKWARAFSAKPPLFPDGNVASVWGSARARIYKLFHPHYVEFTYSDSEMARPLKLGSLIQRERDGRIARRRFVVVFPGTFNNIYDAMPLRAMERFYRLGFHVLILPNSWGTDFVAAGFKHPPGALEEEGAFMARAVRAFVSRLGTENIASMDWIGESYGGFLSAVALAKGPEFHHSDLAARVTLVGPPLSFARAVQRVGKLIDDNRDAYYRSCSGNFNLIRFVLDFIESPFEGTLNRRTRRCSTPLLAYTGFQLNLVDTARVYDTAHQLGIVPKTPRELSEWRRDLTFRDFFRDFAPSAEPAEQDPRVDLGYWLERAERVRGAPVPLRVMTAVDDFLNRPGEWDSNPYFSFDDRRLIKLSWGGHIGYVATEDYESMIRLAFSAE